MTEQELKDSLAVYAALRREQVAQIRALRAETEARIKEIITTGRQARTTLQRINRATEPDKWDGAVFPDAEDVADELELKVVTEREDVYELLSGSASDLPKEGPQPETAASRFLDALMEET